MTGMHSGHAQIRFNNELAERGAVNNYDSVYVHKELEGNSPTGEHDDYRANDATSGIYHRMFRQVGTGVSGFRRNSQQTGIRPILRIQLPAPVAHILSSFLYNDEERVYLSNKVTDPHRSPLDKGADPNDPASYAKYTQKEYANDLIFDELMGFVDANKRKPFFLMWTTPLPHVSLQAPERWYSIM